ncbi:MAG: ATP-binding cassette domain-containing protein [candidate division Zixibacteria bacterium]|nr:ATP-binding cassette domain-containing protein [candidate division Zixibacteria bacterium]
MSRKMLISAKNLTISHLGRPIVDKLTLSVSSGELVGLIGANGCGKSTLLATLQARQAGDEAYFTNNDFVLSGHIDFPNDLSLTRLPQNLRREPEILRDSSIDSAAIRLEHRLRTEFSFDAEHDDLSRLSDGQLQKLALIRTLSVEADLTLLDEPSNYLDIDGLTAFESCVRTMKGRGRGFLMVTHDRTMTDNLADRTVYITPNGIYHTQGGFHQAWALKSSDFESRTKRSTQIKRRIARLQQDVHRKSQWADNLEKSKIGAGSGKPTIAKKAKRMAQRAQHASQKAQKEIENLKNSKPLVPKKLDLAFPWHEIKHRQVFALDDLSFDYDAEDPSDRRTSLLQDVSFSASTTDKICLMGSNGAGKSTLLRLIMKQIAPLSGRSYLNTGVNLHYLPQGLEGCFSEPLLLDNFRRCESDETTVRQYLGAAMIRKDKVTEPINRFSQGELMRAAIVRCLLLRSEFLLLDEPTSHLDIESIEVLERMLDSFTGGFLLISHDRSFVQNVAHQLYLLAGSRLRLV